MAHCPYARLDDLAPLLEGVRACAGLVERKPGIFYFKGQGFLHFHLKDERRWADVREGRGGWGEPIDVPFGLSRTGQSRVLTEIRRRLNLALDLQSKRS